MPKIHVIDSEGEEHTVEGQVGLSLMESLRDLDNGVLALCGGMCSCATCHCYIEESWASKLGDREDDEQELLEDLDSFKEDRFLYHLLTKKFNFDESQWITNAFSRLSCQIEFSEEMDGMRVEIASDE